MKNSINASDMDRFVSKNVKNIMLSFIENKIEEFFDEDELTDFFNNSDIDISENDYEQISYIMEYWNNKMEKAFSILSKEKIPF